VPCPCADANGFHNPETKLFVWPAFLQEKKLAKLKVFV
jgi:hypothetical protein